MSKNDIVQFNTGNAEPFNAPKIPAISRSPNDKIYFFLICQ